ncbi:MAG: YggT family protein [Anaerolineae bacterium]|nr:YggT family protein [Anaerolineae bacterium]
MSIERKEHVEVVHDAGYERRQQVSELAPSTQTVIVSRVIQIIWLLTAIVIALLGLRFVLQLLAANEGNAFASFVFQITNVLVAPFASLFAPSTATNGSAIEWSTLVAGVAYLLLGWLVTTVVRILFGGTGSVRRVRTVERARN